MLSAASILATLRSALPGDLHAMLPGLAELIAVMIEDPLNDDALELDHVAEPLVATFLQTFDLQQFDGWPTGIAFGAGANTAAMFEALGNLAAHQSNLGPTRELHERGLAMREQVVGAEHPATADSLHSLAHLFKMEGDLAAAQEYFERARAGSSTDSIQSQ